MGSGNKLVDYFRVIARMDTPKYIACVAGVRRGEKGERRAQSAGGMLGLIEDMNHGLDMRGQR